MFFSAVLHVLTEALSPLLFAGKFIAAYLEKLVSHFILSPDAPFVLAFLVSWVVSVLLNIFGKYLGFVVNGSPKSAEQLSKEAALQDARAMALKWELAAPQPASPIKVTVPVVRGNPQASQDHKDWVRAVKYVKRRNPLGINAGPSLVQFV